MSTPQHQNQPQQSPRTDPIAEAGTTTDPDLSTDADSAPRQQGAGGQGTAPVLDRETLEDYLNQHLLGSRSGVKMFRTAADTWKDTPYADRLRGLADEIAQEQKDLEQMITGLGMKVSVMQEAVGKVAEAAGRLNPVNLNRSKGNGWTQVELDLLQGALQGKAAMWHVLTKLAEHAPDLDRSETDRLYRQAQDQQAEIQRISEETLATRFFGG